MAEVASSRRLDYRVPEVPFHPTYSVNLNTSR